MWKLKLFYCFHNTANPLLLKVKSYKLILFSLMWTFFVAFHFFHHSFVILERFPFYLPITSSLFPKIFIREVCWLIFFLHFYSQAHFGLFFILALVYKGCMFPRKSSSNFWKMKLISFNFLYKKLIFQLPFCLPLLLGTFLCETKSGWEIYVPL